MPTPVTDNRSYIEKADAVLSDLSSGGLLLAAQAKKFMKIMIEEAKLMKMSTVVPMRSPKQDIDKIALGSRIMRPGTEAAALVAGDRSAPTFSQVELDAKLYKAEIRLTDEILEDSIEGNSLKSTVMSLMSERIAADLEELVVQGDTTSADLYLKTLDGIIKQATSNVVVAGGVPLNKTVLRDCIKAIPKKFLRNKGKMKFLTSVDAETDYRDAIADRQTVLGDAMLTREAPIAYSGIQVSDIVQFPENLGGGTNETVVMFLDPKNIHWGIWRQIKIETDRLVREGVLLIVVTMRMDVKFAEETGVVKATGVTVS